MSRHPKPRRILALIALVLLLLPALATAATAHGEAVRALAERHESALSLFAQLQSLLAVLWKTGSVLEPDGGKPGAPNTTTAGDTGSVLDPNGRN